MANTLANFFASPDPEKPEAPEPTTTVHEEGEAGEPGHNQLIENTAPKVDEPLTPEQGESLYAPQIAQAQEAAEAEQPAPDPATAGSNPYVTTNDLTPPTQDAGENLAARDNIVSPDETVSGASELELRAQVLTLTDTIRNYGEEIAEYDRKLELIDEERDPLVADRAKAAEAQAQVIDEVNSINAVLGD